MKYAMIFLLVSLVVATTGFAVAQDEPIDKEQLTAKITEWLPGMGDENIDRRRSPQQELQKICVAAGAPGNEKDKATVCEVLTETLDADMNAPARVWILFQLEWIGGAECVDAVAKSLSDKDETVQDAARRALENIPASEAGAAIIAAIPKASGEFRVSLINSLGPRGEDSAVDTLSGLLRDRDIAVVSAAANALSKIPSTKATQALKNALNGASNQTIVPIAEAYLACAYQLRLAGKKSEAIAIYGELSNEKIPKNIRLAAMRGKLNILGNIEP